MIDLIVNIHDVFPMKAQFMSGEEINMAVELTNTTTEKIVVQLIVYITFLNKQIEQIELTDTLLKKVTKKLQVAVHPKHETFKGFGVDVVLFHGNQSIQTMSSSFDVVSDWRHSTRYGFLSDFNISEKGDTADVESISKLHLNLVQFYDWMYKHDELVSPVEDFTDLMGRNSNLEVIREKIDLCHQYGMKSIAYGAVYAASRGFYEKHKDWALYNSNGDVLDFIDIFCIMNIAKESPWHEHIINQYRDAIEKLDFDGIHMDTYGSPKTAISKVNNQDKVIRLDEHFPDLINNTRKALDQSKDDIGLIFNNVGNWPVDTVALANQDAVYIEVWNPYERYHHIQQIIAWASHLSKGKPVILAAYLKPFREEIPIEQANTAALLLTAVITSNGGYHLLLGEENGVLTQGYYVDYSKAEEAFMRRLRNYYDFLIRYANIFFDKDLRDVSMTHVNGDNLEYQFKDIDYSTWGAPDKVWTIVREKPGIKVISLINLIGNNDDRWNEGKQNPPCMENINIQIQVEENVKEVFLASPDLDMGRPYNITYELIRGEKGQFVEVTLPKLILWDLLVIELEA